MSVSLPSGLEVEQLALRVDVQKESAQPLLESFLKAAFLQAEKPAPLGCGRLLHPEPAGDTTVAKDFNPNGSRYVHVPDAREITAVTADTLELEPGDLELLEQDGHIVRVKLPRYARRVTLTGKWGFEAVPEDLAEAIYTLAGRMYFEGAAQYADQVAVGDGAPAAAYYRQIPPRTKAIFASYTVGNPSL